MYRDRPILAALALSFVMPAVLTGPSSAEEKLDQQYAAFGVAMGPGISGVLNITINRWSTEEERQTLMETLVKEGQEKMVDALRKMKETGFARTQTGAGMRGWPSVRIHYAHEAEKDGKRVVLLVTDRNMSMAEEMRQGRSVDYDVSGIVMELEPVQGDKKVIERGTGTFFAAVKLTFDKDKKRLEAEYLGTEPVRLTDIRREK